MAQENIQRNAVGPPPAWTWKPLLQRKELACKRYKQVVGNSPKLLVNKDEYKREEVLVMMGDKVKNYSVYRDRLIKRGIISVTRMGYIALALPFFADYVKEYC